MGKLIGGAKKRNQKEMKKQPLTGKQRKKRYRNREIQEPKVLGVHKPKIKVDK